MFVDSFKLVYGLMFYDRLDVGRWKLDDRLDVLMFDDPLDVVVKRQTYRPTSNNQHPTDQFTD